MNSAATEALRELLARVPEIAPHATTTVLLNPRPGTPGSRDSHLGGPLLWPAAEPWPTCDRHPGEDPYDLVSVAQLHAAEAPGLPFPEGTDLLQVLWCPVHHDQPHPAGWGPAGRVVWRRTADVTEEAAEQPDGWAEWQDDPEGVVPRPCVVHPEQLPDLPPEDALPEPLRNRLAAAGAEDLYDLMSAHPGCKAGGCMDWMAATRPADLDCPSCGSPYALLLQVDSYEYLPSDTRGYGLSAFAPPEEQGLAPGTDAHDRASRPTAMSVGRGDSHGGLFVCTAAPSAHPPAFFPG
ncbi:YwqG family protein [Actinacidiphila bryophytorum]|uniref:DUF1963 domain-containing protein n=1 Tax=Actinacidiphila bryophytorum TaxID=1436133 RepID=A0A9W4H1H1_9ACTN|nr:hypothetical protein [Actinacidiphila bryophytorum]MBM9435081.1 hypothetical protein [Actinacidiphila bryophytorum]MBN6543085.1 hypothetical protein [Actinacidiphila bryophytorum]CAG7642996.1 conserved hypothetical protein [Actinacidiphila bryophytorum]